MLEGFCFAAFYFFARLPFFPTWSHSACFPFVFSSCAVFLRCFCCFWSRYRPRYFTSVCTGILMLLIVAGGQFVRFVVNVICEDFVCFIFYYLYFPGVARVFICPNLIVICVPSLAEIAHLDGIFSIVTSTLLGGTLSTRRLIYILLHLHTNYSVEYPTVNSFTFHVTR
jgi:hypothetical protein